METIAEGDADYETSSLGSHKDKEKILVSVRLRPINEKERSRNDASDWECINNSTIVFKASLPDRNMFPSAYTFDRVFGSESSTDQVYEYGAKEVALAVVNGINASIFAYGQTSSGKTYTMSGVTEYAVADIFKYIEKHPDREYVLKFSAMEIYNEAVRDLLSTDATPLRLLDDPERGTVVEKLTEETVSDWNHFLELMEVCQAQRHIGETSLNEMSSRSHQIVRLTVESSSLEFLGPDNPSSLAACVNFIDLAGSERASQTMAVGARLKEGSHINRSLLTLGTVIRKLSKGKTGHIPYRDSKLTRILQNSLGGNARTAIICTMSPARSHVEQSRNTLLFASCAKEVATNAQVNLVMSDKVLVKQLQRELARMERELRSFGTSSTSYNSNDLLREKEAQIQLMDNKINELNRQLELAQSRIDDLQRSTSESKHEEGSSTSGSPVSKHNPPADKRKNLERLNSSKSNLDFAENTEDSFLLDGRSPRISTCTPNSEVPSIPAKPNTEEEIFKDVPCIVVEKPKVQCLAQQETNFPDKHYQKIVKEEMDRTQEVEATKNDNNADVTYDSLRNKIQEMQKTIDNIVNVYPKEEGNNPSGSGAVDAPNPTVKRSRSSRSLLMGIAPYRTPAGSEVGFSGSVCGVPRRYGSIKGSVVSFQTEVTEFIDNQSYNNAGVERYRPGDVNLTQVNESSEDDDDEDDRDQEAMVQRFAWESEFNIRRAKIMELWQVCNVPLVHRSFFFLLFEGDPSDLHYLEVEMRRLNFLKNSMFGRSQNSTLASSIKALNKERESLSKRIQKKFPNNKEREALYKKWNIDLNTRQRSVQLAKRLWSEPKDIIHVKESAKLVEKLVGVLEAKKIPKEIFGLSFSPEPLLSRRPSMWTPGASSTVGVSSILGS